MTAMILYSLAIILFIISLINDKLKTKNALIKAFKSFENIMPQFLSIIIIVGFILSILDTNTISKLIGLESGILGVFFFCNNRLYYTYADICSFFNSK